MVVIFLLLAADTGIEQERTGVPSRCTVQAPHWAIPHPYFVPVSPTTSRIAQSNGILGSTSTVCSLLLIFNFIEAMIVEFVAKKVTKLLFHWLAAGQVNKPIDVYYTRTVSNE
jgi:hypothetical protein